MSANTVSKLRSWLRFSLRTFFVVLPGWCIWFGILAARAHRQRVEVDSILAAGGTVWFDYQWFPDNCSPNPDGQPRGPAWLRQLLGEDFFRTPMSVGLKG